MSSTNYSFYVSSSEFVRISRLKRTLHPIFFLFLSHIHTLSLTCSLCCYLLLLQKYILWWNFCSNPNLYLHRYFVSFHNQRSSDSLLFIDLYLLSLTHVICLSHTHTLTLTISLLLSFSHLLRSHHLIVEMARCNRK